MAQMMRARRGRGPCPVQGHGVRCELGRELADYPQYDSRTSERAAWLQEARSEMADSWSIDELVLKDKVLGGQTVVANISAKGHPNLWRWAEAEGLAVRIDRKTPWGNPHVVGRDGSREDVCDSYAYDFPSEGGLLHFVPSLKGKVLGCWCAPLRCHGDFLAELANND